MRENGIVSEQLHFRLRAALVTLLALAVAGSLFASAKPKPLPPGTGRYLIVLWEAGTPIPGDPTNGHMRHVPEPDLVKLGGELISSESNRRLAILPRGIVKQLKRHEAVAYVQPIWSGEPLEDWEEANASDETGFRATTNVVLEPQTDVDWGARAYEYDGSGNIKTFGNDHYTYDTAGRLIKAVVGGKTERFKYDEFGNLKEKAVDGGATVVIPVDGSSNRLSGSSYDVAGNMTRSGRYGYEWDSSGSLTQVNGSDTQRMIYDADEERIAMILGSGGSTWTIRDFSGKPLREYRTKSVPDADWRWAQDFIYGEGRLVAGETQKWSYNGPSTPFEYGGLRHYHLDHLGSVRIVTNEAGKSLSEHDYYPFGASQTAAFQEQVNWTDQHVDKMRFAGHSRDFLGAMNDESADYVDYMHARYYQPSTGRFLSVDPYLDIQTALRMPQSWNRYSYAHNNPIRYVDPDGKNPAAGYIVGGMIGGAVEGAVIQMGFNVFLDRPLMENVGESAATGAVIGGVTMGIGTLARGAMHAVRFGGPIRAALNSADDAVRLEGQAAAALGQSVTGFQKVVKAGGRTVGEIDVETSKAIVEVTTGRSPGKLQQVLALINDKTLNPAGKQVVVYGPNLGKHAAKTLQEAGARVVRTVEELQKYAQ